MPLDLAPSTGGRQSLVCPLSLRNLALMLTRRALSLLLRSLAVICLVGLTSLGVVAAPVSHAVGINDPNLAQRWTAKTAKYADKAARVGSKAAPLSKLRCLAGPVMASICGGTILGGLWLGTEDGRQFQDDVMARLRDFNLGPDRASRSCQATVTPDVWGQYQVSFSVSLVGTYEKQPGVFVDCSSHFAPTAVAAVSGVCMRPDGSLYDAQNRAITQTSTIAHLCPFNASDWLVAATTYSGGNDAIGLTNQAHYRNPLWSGTPEQVAGVDGYWDRGAKTRVRLTCRNDATGAETTKTVTVDGTSFDPAAECDPGSTGIRRIVEFLRNQGKVVQAGYDVGVSPADRAAFSECFTSAGCDMGVYVDGSLCHAGRPECVRWWDVAQENPQRVTCQWGPYSLPYGDCAEFRNSYVSADGSWIPTDLPTGQPAIPYYPDQPEYRPPPPVGNGADPSWIRPDQCPPAPAANFAYGVTEYGLQPVTVQGLRCFIKDHSDFIVSSAWRSQGSSAWYSDHPHGLAVDLVPPNWQAESGRQRGWDAAAYWVHNARELGVRYVIFDSAIWWPATGWHVYDGPSPHRDHVHVSFDPDATPVGVSAPAPAPTIPAPIPTPSPEPAPPTNPQPPTPVPQPPGTTPEPQPPGFPVTGTNPSDPDDCLSSMWSWNPVDWVATPVKCSLLWAFVPKAETVTQVQADVADGVGATGVTTWVDVVGSIPDALESDESAASCRGPGMAFPEPIGTVYVLDACSGIRATLAAACKTIAGASIAVGAVLSCLSLVSRAIGYDTALSTVTAPLAAPGPGDAAASSSAASSGGMTFSAAEMRMARASAKVTERMRNKS